MLKLLNLEPTEHFSDLFGETEHYFSGKKKWNIEVEHFSEEIKA